MWIGIHSPGSKSCSGLNSSSAPSVVGGERERRQHQPERQRESAKPFHGSSLWLAGEVERERNGQLERVGESVQQDDGKRESRVRCCERDDDNHHRQRSKGHSEAHHA